jgi:hypothetical protein
LKDGTPWSVPLESIAFHCGAGAAASVRPAGHTIPHARASLKARTYQRGALNPI